ncbi:MAG: hypothetical protein LUC32_05730, partial [Clostridiales bacterium]|nr:hypothetical protein [Clostridiales bacterium]
MASVEHKSRKKGMILGEERNHDKNEFDGRSSSGKKKIALLLVIVVLLVVAAAAVFIVLNGREAKQYQTYIE